MHTFYNRNGPAAAPWRAISSDWLTLKLRDDVSALISADQEFALFMAAEKQRTQRAMQHAKILKVIATLLAFVLLGVVLAGAYLIMRQRAALTGR